MASPANVRKIDDYRPRNIQKKAESGNRFFQAHRSIFKSKAFTSLSLSARLMLVAMGLEFCGFNNGRIVMTAKVAEGHGFTGNGTRTRSIAELIDAGFLVLTRRGARPHKAAYYGLPWEGIDDFSGLDITPEEWSEAAGKLSDTICASEN